MREKPTDLSAGRFVRRSSEPRKLLVLGAGVCQLPLIRCAQGHGFHVIVASKGGDYPGFAVADTSHEVDVRDMHRLLEIAKEERIVAVTTDQTDIAVPTVAFIAEAMGLPGVGYECALNFTNKFRMRRLAQANGIPVPQFALVRSEAEATVAARRIGFPLIIKPVDNQGSRGVSCVAVADELPRKLAKATLFSPSRQVILEESFKGNEVVVGGFVLDYRHTNLVCGDRKYFESSYGFIPKQTLFPSEQPQEIQQQIFRLNQRMIQAFAPRFGITHSEFLVNPLSGQIALVETAIRGGGVFISSDLIPLVSGVNVTEMLLACVLGKEVPHNWEQHHHRAAGYVCFALPEGIIRCISGVDALERLPTVHRIETNDLYVGAKVKSLRDKSGRCGPIIVAGADRTECDQAINAVQRSLRIEVETPNGISGIVW